MFIGFIENLNKRKGHYILFILLLIAIVVMRYFDSFLITEISPNGIVSFELAKELSGSKQIINSWDTIAKNAAGLSLGFDFLFLMIYSSFISMLIYNLNKRLFLKTSYHAWQFIIFLIPFIAAFFDIIENIALIKLLLGDLNQIWSSMAFYFALVKFGLLSLGIVYILTGGLILIFIKKK